MNAASIGIPRIQKLGVESISNLTTESHLELLTIGPNYSRLPGMWQSSFPAPSVSQENEIKINSPLTKYPVSRVSGRHTMVTLHNY
jgi:hypothetical protein